MNRLRACVAATVILAAAAAARAQNPYEVALAQQQFAAVTQEIQRCQLAINQMQAAYNYTYYAQARNLRMNPAAVAQVRQRFEALVRYQGQLYRTRLQLGIALGVINPDSINVQLPQARGFGPGLLGP